jgi:hypothetical protein
MDMCDKLSNNVSKIIMISEKGKSWETVRRKAKGLNHMRKMWMAAGCHEESWF